MNRLDLPKGTLEYVTMVVTRTANDVDPSTLTAKIAIVTWGTTPVSGDFNTATWLTDVHGWGVLTNTTAMSGKYAVWLKVTATPEVPLLGPALLTVG
jgi:hypothetical protein